METTVPSTPSAYWEAERTALASGRAAPDSGNTGEALRRVIDAVNAHRPADPAERAALALTRARCLRDLGGWHGSRGEIDPAARLWREAAEAFARQGAPLEAADAWRRLGRLEAARRDALAAAEGLHRAAELLDAEGEAAEAALCRLEVALARTESRWPSPADHAAADGIREAVHRAVYAVERHGSLAQRIRAQQTAEHVARLMDDRAAVSWHLAQRADLLEQALEAVTESVPVPEAPAAPDTAVHAFLQRAAHDMKEPIRMVASFGALLRRRHVQSLGEDGREFLEQVMDGGARLQELMDKLQAWARLPADGPAAGTVAFEDLVVLLGASRGEAFARQGVRLETRGRAEWPGSREHWSAVLDQLVDNALRFHETGAARLLLSAETTPRSVILRLEDDGIGIPVADRDAVFEPFRRLHPRSAYRGSGMGLAIVARTAALYGGTAHAEDSALGGTAIVLTLPRS
jgi:signal transduction histidine kinase